MKYCVILLVFIPLTLSCEQEANLAYPTHQSLPVLNGILQPDSTVQIRLTESVPLGNEAVFPPIEDANIKLFENGEFLGLGIYQGTGKYSWDYKPLPGKAYTIEATIPSYQQILLATDTVPTIPKVLKAEEYDPESGSLRIFQFSLQNRIKDPEVYWFSSYYTFFETEYDFENRVYIIDSTVRIKESFNGFMMKNPSFFVDDFNRWFDNLDRTYVYDYYLRMDDGLLKNAPFDLEISTYQSVGGANTIYYLVFIHASPIYDKYLKSSLIHYLDTEEGDEANPLSTPVRVYSNIQNGLGIFAARNMVTIELIEE